MSAHTTPDALERQRTISASIVNKIVTDATFRQRLVNSPEAALREAGFLDEYVALQHELQADVTGYSFEIEGEAAPEESRSCQCCVTVLY